MKADEVIKVPGAAPFAYGEVLALPPKIVAIMEACEVCVGAATPEVKYLPFQSISAESSICSLTDDFIFIPVMPGKL